MNYDNMTREELIDELKKIHTMVEHLAITYNEHQDLLAERDLEHHNMVRIIPGEKYTCECGAEITFKARKRHEASARHIRMVAQIRD
jgi:shikimate kinase